ncbi:preprotein translocase subunit SecY [Candidatus Xianfuyuplasma coldseepsis]|uniref:Protein translocase subunit SecY n=1 Tax=Candidatus Xianfuyuplasma coldseepsis TaxID=2782163 RepID=A0A7L7KTT9_9MOLU|nr:preprotein translocase subunit SecY [Xianfuyuplasma coldseepsis]QMS85198.1 preprotein translocase subunit SecY [Xianfuyuplasma coldseepsis]
MENIVAALKNKDVMKKIGFTFLVFLIYKLATYITIPLINQDIIQSFFDSADSGFLGIANAFTGNALKNYSIIALGIGPYITASIITQLLQMDIIPLLKEWQEEGETGKQKINQLNRYLAIGLAFIQALAMTYGFRLTGNAIFDIGVTNVNFVTYTYLAIVMTAGTAFLLWLSDQITLYGVGNGTSMIIVAGIVSTMPLMITSMIEGYLVESVRTTESILIFTLVMVLYIAVIFFVTVMQSAFRKIPIQYSNRPASARFQGKSDSHIPLKINSAGVIPVIFAVTILSIPTTILSFVGALDGTLFGRWLTEMFTYQQPLGYAVYVILIYVFAFFYSFVQINPEKMADNLQKQHAYIPGVRPGTETENYISKTLFRITIIGATYLVLVASLPIFVAMIFDLPAYVQIGGTSLLIVVGVAIETTKQIKTQTQEQNYSGFIK